MGGKEGRKVGSNRRGDTLSGETAVAAANHLKGTQAAVKLLPATISAAVLAFPLACPSLSDNPEMWMQVTSMLGVPALGRMACTAARFRAVVSSCVRASAAQALVEVLFEPSHKRVK